MKKTTFISFDTETTGFSFKKGDRIVEIGAVKILDGNIIDTFQVYINPERNIPNSVVKVHGITNEKVKNSPLFHEVIESFLNFVGDSVYVAHNAGFDIDFIGNELNNSIKKHSVDSNLLEAFMNSKVIDTMEYSKRTFKKGRHSLNALSDRLDVDRSHREFHGALLDADILAHVFINIGGGSQISLMAETDVFDVVLASSYLGGLDVEDNVSFVKYRARKLPDLTREEVNAHLDMLKRIDKESDGNLIGSSDNWGSNKKPPSLNKEDLPKKSLPLKTEDKGAILQSPNFRF